LLRKLFVLALFRHLQVAVKTVLNTLRQA